MTLAVNLPDSADRPRPVVAQRQHVRNSRRHNARNGTGAVQDIVNESVLLRGARYAKARVHAQRRRPLRLKSQLHIEDAKEAAYQQTRAHQQDAGEGQFGNHQSIADPRMPPAAT